jgi:hypothetical protein
MFGNVDQEALSPEVSHFCDSVPKMNADAALPVKQAPGARQWIGTFLDLGESGQLAFVFHRFFRSVDRPPMTSIQVAAGAIAGAPDDCVLCPPGSFESAVAADS